MKALFLSTAICLVSLAFPSGGHAQTAASDPAIAPAGAPVTSADNTVGAAIPAAPDGTVPVVAPADGTIVAAVPPAPNSMIPTPTTTIEKEIGEQIAFQKPTVNPNLMPSLFFTSWEHDLLVDARRGLTTRMPGTDDGVGSTGPRDISLAGIVYHNSKEWTIWLNNLRVSPTAIPDEVLDLKVHKDYIELEWFDSSTNQIFPIRMRAHQRFNLDTRMFLPG